MEMPVTTKPNDDDALTGLHTLDLRESPLRNAEHFRAIVAAKKKVARAEAELAESVAAARAAGDSWTVIGAALDTSRQNAQQRFGR